jgi:DnaK suppressor protein
MNETRVRARLEEERVRLQRVREAISASGVAQTAREGPAELSAQDQHPADLGTETFEREKEISTLQGVDERLDDVDRALRRLDRGTYGSCELCGEAIEPSRLEAVPFARYCVKHQMEIERSARLPGVEEIPRETA